jgi:hypothetical protein
MNKCVLSLSLSLAALTLAGCSSQPKPERIMKYITTDSAPVGSNNASTEQELMQASSSVSTSMQNLSAVQSAATPAVRTPAPITPQGTGMTQRVSINWIGPVQPILQKLAGNAGYRVQVIGSKPSMPIIVSINVHNQALADIYRSIVYQSQSQASLSLHASQRLIILHYKN